MHVYACALYIYIYIHESSCTTISQLRWGTQNCLLKIFLWNCFVFIDYILSFSLYPTSQSLLWHTSFPASLSSINKSLGLLSKKSFHPHTCYVLPLFHSLAKYEIKVLVLTKIHTSRKRGQTYTGRIREWMSGLIFQQSQRHLSKLKPHLNLPWGFHYPN